HDERLDTAAEILVCHEIALEPTAHHIERYVALLQEGGELFLALDVVPLHQRLQPALVELLAGDLLEFSAEFGALWAALFELGEGVLQKDFAVDDLIARLAENLLTLLGGACGPQLLEAGHTHLFGQDRLAVDDGANGGGGAGVGSLGRTRYRLTDEADRRVRR